MPNPLSTTLLASAVIMALVSAPVAAFIFMALALLIELARFLFTAAEPVETQEVLVRSGEEPPEQGRTTLLRG